MKIMRCILLLVAAVAFALPQSPNAKPTQSSSTTSVRKHGLIDINSAGPDELDSLPGIGPVMAQKIIAGRPYRAKTDLLNRKIIPQSAYDKIKDRIIAHRQK